MNSSLTGRQPLYTVVLVAACLAVASNGSAATDDDRWTVRLGLTHVSVDGHDPHVLTVVGPSDGQAYKMKTESGVGKQLGLRYERGEKWAWGADLDLFTAAQRLRFGPAAAEADGAPVSFTITERVFTSTEPSEVLYFERLGDTDISLWTLDVYALRSLLDRSDSAGLQLLLGVRNADFDNDSHFAAGIETVGGSRIDASSNYSRMIGPLLGLVAYRELGRHRFEAKLAVSVVTADVELSSMLTDYTGSLPPEEQDIVGQRDFRESESVTVPMADLHLGWGYAATDRLTFTLGLDLSEWNDLAIPPGVRPSGALATLYETSLTLSALSAGIELSF